MHSQQKTILYFVLIFIFSVSLFVLSDLRQIYVDPETREVRKEWLNPIVIIWDGVFENTNAEGEVQSTSKFDVVARLSMLFNFLYLLFFLYTLIKSFIKSSFKGDLVRLFIVLTFWLSLARVLHTIGYFLLSPIVVNGWEMQWDYFPWESPILNVVLVVLSILAWKSIVVKTASETSFKTLGVPSWNRPFYMMFDRTIVLLLVGNTFYFQYYYLNIHPSWRRGMEEGEDPNYAFWGWLLSSFILVVIYVLSEKYFGFTPGKLLMGTRVVKEDSNENIGFGSSLARTFSRFIPFENLSIFARSPWHDSISKSQLVYEGNTSWFQRQGKVVRGFSIVYLVAAVWLLFMVVKIILRELIRNDNYSDRIENLFTSAHLPMALVVIGSFMMQYLLSGWLASLNAHFENIHERNATSRGGMYFEALCMWIPVVHFFLPSRINGNIRANIEINFGESEAETRVYRRSRLWGAFFHVYMIFSWIGWLAIFSYLGRMESMLVGCAFIAFGSLFLTIGTIAYARAFELLDLNESMLITQKDTPSSNGEN